METGISRGGKNTVRVIDTFYGLNRTRRPVNGECGAMRNMSSAEFPCASPCAGREVIAEAPKDIDICVAPDEAFSDSITGITGVYGRAFYYNGVRKTTITGMRTLNTLEIDLPDGCEWELVKNGDMYIINGYSVTDKRSYIYYYDVERDVFSFASPTMPNMVVRVASDNTGLYFEALNNMRPVYTHTAECADGTQIKGSDYISLYSYGSFSLTDKLNVFSNYFSTGDELCVYGFRESNEGQYFEIKDNAVSVLGEANWTRLNTVDTDDVATTYKAFIGKPCKMVVTGFSKIVNTNSYHRMYIKVYDGDGEEIQYGSFGTDFQMNYCAGVTIAKKIPAIRRICMHQGRLWGASPSGRQLYASASDRLFSFSDADMVNKYSWRSPMDATGVVTGIATYNGELVAFKSNAICIVMGTNPRNYQLQTMFGTGCIAPRSVIATPKGVMFLSYNGFCIYNGTYPRPFGDKLKYSYTDAVAGYDGRRYYACAELSGGEREMLVYDTRNGMWHREDDFPMESFMRFRDGVYISDRRRIYKLNNTIRVPWDMTLAELSGFDTEGVNEVWIKAEITDGEFTVYTDLGDNNWKRHATFNEPCGLAVYRAPIRHIRADSFRLRLAGEGYVVIHGIELVTAVGGRRVKERI